MHHFRNNNTTFAVSREWDQFQQKKQRQIIWKQTNKHNNDDDDDENENENNDYQSTQEERCRGEWSDLSSSLFW